MKHTHEYPWIPIMNTPTTHTHRLLMNTHIHEYRQLWKTQNTTLKQQTRNVSIIHEYPQITHESEVETQTQLCIYIYIYIHTHM